VDGHAFLVRRPAKETLGVVLTSSGNPKDKEAALQSGARDYIVKPFDLDGYTDAVSIMIRKWTRCRSSVNRQIQLRLSAQKN
jgi:DNA-binding response OmpR family regulator